MPRGVAQALRAMGAEPARIFTIADLARIANVSPRTLQRQFQTFVGKSPLAALHDIKFEHARRALLRAVPHSNVTEIAHRSGFRHLGRFSLDYRRRFGEPPSRTLRRQRDVLRNACVRVSRLVPPGDHPSVAILPIETNDRFRELARGLVDELTTTLVEAGIRVSGGPAVARYHLHGTLRSEGREFRLTYRLIDSATASLIWAHYFRAAGERDFAFGKSLAETIAAALGPVLLAAEVRRARRKPDTDLTAYDLALRAMSHALALSNSGSNRALDLLRQALARDSSFTLAIALASWCHAQRAAYPFSDRLTHDRAQALNLARQIVDVDADATINAILGNALALLGDLPTADVVTQKALAMSGSSSWAWARSGLIQVCQARPADAIERLTIALDLASTDPVKLNCFMGLGAAHLETGQFFQAAGWFERAVLEYPNAIWPNEFLGPAYVYCGRSDDARKSFTALQHAFPELTVSRVTAGLPFFTQRIRDIVANGLEKVGMRA